MNPSDATREVLWNISNSWIMYALLLPTLLIAGNGILLRIKRWKKGRPVDRLDRPLERLQNVWRHAVLQRRTMRNRYAGIFHAFIFWGFITLTLATTVVFLHHDFGWQIMQGRFYLYFQSLFVDLLGLLALIGVGMAAWRRAFLQPRFLVQSSEATWILVLAFIILGTGFLLEGWRIAATDDPWGNWSPVGSLIATFSIHWMSVETMQFFHWGVWWFHLLLVFGFIAWAPYTKMLHPLTATLNIYAANLKPIGASLKTIDFESEESFGINRLDHFTWKDLMDLDACTECGRCTAVCPAATAGKSLSPRDIILDLREKSRISNKRETTFSDPIIGTAPSLSTESLWQCTSCAACVESCPVSIEQFPKIIDMRRFQVMEEAVFPEPMQQALASIESRGHPFSGSRFSRLDWTEGLNIPEIKDRPDAEVLVWTGCGGSLVERNQKSSRALTKILDRAGISYAILGREEKCTGDPARRMGNEFLFQELAKQNIQTFEKYKVKTVVTSCAHCFNTFRNEYPEQGGQFEVFHHSEYLKRLLDQGKLPMKSSSDRKITLHDPCYLSRHNHMTEDARSLLQQTSSQPLIELERNRQNSFCCGGGGGLSFTEEPSEQRVNRQRADEILKTDVDTVAVACPFCTTMLEDGINACKGSRDIKVKELSELILESLETEE
ncbi:MAG TPA: 4Fe-4S dicluster domain-containing protein [Verrucomicrobiales bacterium]|nr:4Fe-4S dicluster domain-containing protein [Verrucomicrobiales bacterium]